MKASFEILTRETLPWEGDLAIALGWVSETNPLRCSINCRGVLRLMTTTPSRGCCKKCLKERRL